MEHKIFLAKYRVAQDEMGLAAAESTTVAVTATEQIASARIYRGEDIESGRTLTLEVIPAASFKPSVRAKLDTEATAAKQINHINIPALYDFGIEDDQFIYVTEYFEGTSAEEWVNQHGPMPTGAALRIALQVIGAMGAASFHKISHHAINPANLILVPGQTPEGDWPLIKVLHFIGVAPTFMNGDMSVAAFDKSSHYASPEQLQGGAVDFRSEIYSLGATMWFLLTGAPPLMAPKGPVAMQLTTTGLAVDKLKGMPKRVRRLVSQMLAVDPAARPQDPLAFYRQIQDCIARVIAANNHPPPPTVAPALAERPRVAANEQKFVEKKSPAPEPPKVAANESKPVEEQSTAPAPEPPKIAANNQPAVEEQSSAPETKELTRTEVRKEKTGPAPQTTSARRISPEVRRAEPAAPAEGPAEVAPAPEKKVEPTTKVRKERARNPKPAPDEESIPRAVPADGDEEVVPSQAPQVQQLPRGRTRAKFIGVTADGNWMFSLPNKKIVIVPPPPGG